MPNINESSEEKEIKGGSYSSLKSSNIPETMTKDTKRRGRPPGSKNKTKLGPPPADVAPKADPLVRQQPPPPLPRQNAASLEPLTKRAKIQAELQQGLQPVAIGTASTASGRNTPGGTKPPVVPIRRPSQPQSNPDLQNVSAKETPRSLATTAAAATVASETIPRSASSQKPTLCSPLHKDPSPPDPLPNGTKSNITKFSGKTADLAPGEALRSWLEENQVVVEEEKLIEELPEDIPLHQPSAEELASNAACAEFQALLPGLTSAREAIGHAAAAASKVAATGASARAVRMVVDAASDASGPPERLPYLYLLDSLVKLELRQAREREGKEEEKKEEGVQSGFRRAVGAALQRLVHLLLGDDQIRKKIDKLLGIWQREGIIAASLIGPVMESLEHDALRRKKELASTHEKKLKALLKEMPMNAMMRITYAMPSGEEVVLGPPAHLSEPDDWSTPGELGIEVPASAPQPGAGRKMNFLSSSSASAIPHSQSIGASPEMNQAQRKPLPPGYREEEMSPWRRESHFEAEHAKICHDGGNYMGSFNTTNGYFQPAPMPPREQQPADEEEGLDEFDQNLLRDAYGGIGAAGGGSGSSAEVGGLVVDPPPVPPSAPSHRSIFNSFGVDGTHADQCETMPMNDAVFTGVGVGVNTGSLNMTEQWQQQAHMQEQMMMMMQQQMAMPGGPMGMPINTVPLQQQQVVNGGFGAVPPTMTMGMQLPSQQQQFAMMNASMMGNDFGTGMGMQQQQQQGGGGKFGGRGGDGQGGHGRQGGGYKQHQRDNQQHRQHQRQQNRYDPRK